MAQARVHEHVGDQLPETEFLEEEVGGLHQREKEESADVRQGTQNQVEEKQPDVDQEDPLGRRGEVTA
jgi:hypothetical protein